MDVVILPRILSLNLAFFGLASCGGDGLPASEYDAPFSQMQQMYDDLLLLGPTPASEVPMAGSATYQGYLAGQLYPSSSSGGYISSSEPGYISGDVTINADFASGDISGSITNLTGYDSDGNAFPEGGLTASIGGGSYGGEINGGSITTDFSGSLFWDFGIPSVTRVDGTINGQFMGQNHEGLIANFDGTYVREPFNSYFDSTQEMNGTIAATQK